MRFSVLGSGSAGNCIVFGSCDCGYWLIDAGLSAKQITLRLESRGIPLDAIKGIFITHEHKDHIGGLKVLLKKLEAPVYASVLTQEYIASQLDISADWVIFEPGQPFQVESLRVEAIRIPHDATDPVGYLIKDEYTSFAAMTDLGYASDSLAHKLRGYELLYLESNYDNKLLELDQKRPWSIKQRIASRHGHLSNEQASELLQKLEPHGLQKVALGHLSRDCNTAECIQTLFAQNHPTLDYQISQQLQPTCWLEILPPPPSPSVDSSKWEQPTLFDL